MGARGKRSGTFCAKVEGISPTTRPNHFRILFRIRVQIYRTIFRSYQTTNYVLLHQERLIDSDCGTIVTDRHPTNRTNNTVGVFSLVADGSTIRSPRVTIKFAVTWCQVRTRVCKRTYLYNYHFNVYAIMSGIYRIHQCSVIEHL